ncbi:Rhamnogalacturonan I rhamnosyltransferase 1 [Linum grandiflorum]
MADQKEKVEEDEEELSEAADTQSRPHLEAKFCILMAAVMVVLFVRTMELTSLKNRFVSPMQWRTVLFPSAIPARAYRSNGYLTVSCNGGLNQMRTGICDIVAIARFLNVTLIVPELDNTSYWHDDSSFDDIFDTDHFIRSLADEVTILKTLPSEEQKMLEFEPLHSIEPVFFQNMSYYYQKILPQIRRHRVLHFLKADAIIANNGLPQEFQKMRCRACYEALRFRPGIEEMGRKIVGKLQQKGPFLALHLRYEIDILSFTGCVLGLSHDEIVEVMNLRKSYPWWKSIADPRKKRQAGLCPLTPEEIALALQALGIDRNIQIYIASGEIYKGETTMGRLTEAFPNLVSFRGLISLTFIIHSLNRTIKMQVRKETLIDPSSLEPFRNHANAMAALDYIVAVESDIFVPSFDGNMTFAVEGHRRYLGFRKTIKINRKLLVSLFDQYKIGKRSWNEFCFVMKAAHVGNRMGSPAERLRIPDEPFKEDSFYANPQECLPQHSASP